MAINIKAVSEKIFNILKGHGYDVASFDKDGKKVINPEEATRFAVAKPNILVRLGVNDDTLYLATSEDLSEHPVRTMLKNLARDYLMSFDYKVFDKTIKPKGEKVDIAKNGEKDMADVMEGFGAMSGSTKTSYQPLENVKIIVRHKKAVNEESRGSRSRNIHSIYIQRGEERFKMNENSLKAARAMARHMNNGGEMYDSVGQSISAMATDYKKLHEFVRYVRRAGLVNETNEQYVNLAVENISQIRNTFDRLSSTRNYASAVESLGNYAGLSMLEEDATELESAFTETRFDKRVEEAISSIKRTMAKQKAFEATIAEAVAKETFEGIKERLHENGVVDFDNPRAHLGYQVAQMGYAAQNPTLSNYLHSISQKLNSGGDLSQHEYGTIKSCLLSAKEAQVKESKAGTIPKLAEYEKFLESFIIF